MGVGLYYNTNEGLRALGIRALGIFYSPTALLLYRSILYDVCMLDFIRPKIIPIILGIIFVNVLFLDYHMLFRSSQPLVQNINLSNGSQKSNTQPSDTEESQEVQNQASTTNTCAVSCLDAIKSATASLKLAPPVVVTQAPSQTTTQSSGPQEYFIPFGAGSGASQGTYTSLPALSAYVNTSNYSSISTVTFEVSAQIPNGNQSISIQLYDVTDGYAIPNSQVTMSGGTPQLLISPNITLPTGNKLYQVQINTQLNSAITIDQARLHITTQ